MLITGEHGTRKEVAAQTFHALSASASRPLVAVNTGAIPDGLFESELFGHVKGAFTDARTDRIGRFELADGGTIFLDEIGNLPVRQQAKLLRVLESGEVERVGASRSRRVSVRVLSATNTDLPAACAAGQFREDLLFRLNTVEIHIPPLRERREDIPVLGAHFLARYAARYRRSRWGNYPLVRVNAGEVELWLRSLTLARASCAKIRNLMSVLFNHGIRHEICDRNPIRLVRQSAKRKTVPVVLTPMEVQRLLSALACGKERSYWWRSARVCG